MTRIVKHGGEKVAFDERKLFASVYHPALETGYDDEEAEELAETVCDEVKAWMEEHKDDLITTKELREKVAATLGEHDADAQFAYETYLDIN